MMWEFDQEVTADTKCSFCHKGKDEVSRLTKGVANVFICNECVDLYREHIENTSVEDIKKGERIMHLCKKCGTRPPISHRYCYNCGFKLTKKPPEPHYSDFK